VTIRRDLLAIPTQRRPGVHRDTESVKHPDECSAICFDSRLVSFGNDSILLKATISPYGQAESGKFSNFARTAATGIACPASVIPRISMPSRLTMRYGFFQSFASRTARYFNGSGFPIRPFRRCRVCVLPRIELATTRRSVKSFPGIAASSSLVH
jgi:hypothetical protein